MLQTNELAPLGDFLNKFILGENSGFLFNQDVRELFDAIVYFFLNVLRFLSLDFFVPLSLSLVHYLVHLLELPLLALVVIVDTSCVAEQIEHLKILFIIAIIPFDAVSFYGIISSDFHIFVPF